MTEACRTCRFYLSLILPMGECRRYPRVRCGEVGTFRVGFYYPTVADFDWCGEWQPTKEAQEKL